MNKGEKIETMGRYGKQSRYVLENNTVVLNEHKKTVTVFSNYSGLLNGVNKGYFIPFK